ncbi:MAG: DM13 domain-containing protein [Nitrosopumilaceae archaeon]
MNKTKIIGVAVVGIVAIVIVGYTAGPLFYDVTVNEEMPVATLSIPMGNFVGVGDGIHDAQGDVLIIESDDGSRFLRFENFKATNGPDLYVYLSTDQTAEDYVSLGMLKGNIGNQNYMIPPGADLSNYDMVLIWCKQFSVLFGSAKLA